MKAIITVIAAAISSSSVLAAAPQTAYTFSETQAVRKVVEFPASIEHVVGVREKRVKEIEVLHKQEAPLLYEYVKPEPPVLVERLHQVELVGFSDNDASVTPAQRTVLSAHLERLRNAKTLALVGHTDARGSERFNDELGARRAEAVRQLLAEKQLSAKSRSAGEHEPLADNRTQVGQATNRRVTLEYKEVTYHNR